MVQPPAGHTSVASRPRLCVAWSHQVEVAGEIGGAAGAARGMAGFTQRARTAAPAGPSCPGWSRRIRRELSTNVRRVESPRVEVAGEIWGRRGRPRGHGSLRSESGIRFRAVSSGTLFFTKLHS